MHRVLPSDWEFFFSNVPCCREGFLACTYLPHADAVVTVSNHMEAVCGASMLVSTTGLQAQIEHDNRSCLEGKCSHWVSFRRLCLCFLWGSDSAN